MIVSRNQCAEVVAVEIEESKRGTVRSVRRETVLIHDNQPSTAAPPLPWQEKQVGYYFTLFQLLWAILFFHSYGECIANTIDSDCYYLSTIIVIEHYCSMM